jgi:hypothetical protein
LSAGSTDGAADPLRSEAWPLPVRAGSPPWRAGSPPWRGCSRWAGAPAPAGRRSSRRRRGPCRWRRSSPSARPSARPRTRWRGSICWWRRSAPQRTPAASSRSTSSGGPAAGCSRAPRCPATPWATTGGWPSVSRSPPPHRPPPRSTCAGGARPRSAYGRTCRRPATTPPRRTRTTRTPAASCSSTARPAQGDLAFRVVGAGGPAAAAGELARTLGGAGVRLLGGQPIFAAAWLLGLAGACALAVSGLRRGGPRPAHQLRDGRRGEEHHQRDEAGP